MKRDNDFDAFVIGAGPNGLAAAITLRRAGLAVKLIEAKDTIGGGARTAEVTLSGFRHDICSAIFPLAYDSPFFQSIPQKENGLKWIFPDVAMAHPLDNNNGIFLSRDWDEVRNTLKNGAEDYEKIFKPLAEQWDELSPFILDPLRAPFHLRTTAKFGLKALRSASFISNKLSTESTKALWAGMAAHGMLPLHHQITAAAGMVLAITAHTNGWPFPEGGAQNISDALGKYFISLGGEIETGREIKNIDELPDDSLKLMDITPKQLLALAGHKFHFFYNAQLKRYKYGMGVFKVDWALKEPVPFTDNNCRRAGTVHLGGKYEAIAEAEKMTWKGRVPEKPFVLLGQHSLFDNTRAPEGKHTLWGYCHVPLGSEADMTDAIEDQIERFAPGFRETIIGKHTMNAAEMQAYNSNYVGGDINGGAQKITQLLTRPVVRISPYSTPDRNIWICSSSSPPGGGVHGMSGYNAAKRALRDIYGIRVTLDQQGDFSP